METVLKAISDWIKSLLTAAIMSNLSGLFDDVNTQVGSIAQQVGTKPSNFEPRVFAMIEALSRNVVLPIAGIILTFVACYELIQMITEHNNMANFEPVLLMKWIFKTAISVWMISNTFDIIMAVFDVTQQVVANSSGIISGNTRVNDIGLSMLQSSMMQMDVGPLFGLFLQSFFIGITMRILSIVIFVIVYAERKNHLQDLQTQRNKAEKDLLALKTEVLACIKGESVLPRETLAEMITAQEEKLTELENLCEAASEELEKTAELMDKVSRLYDELISYADLYDSANFEAKKMIVNQLIRRVDVYRGYQINISFNFDLTPYIEGE